MIEELARHLGIESHYTDFYGNAHTVPRSSLTALAVAIGYPVHDDAEAAEAFTPTVGGMHGIAIDPATGVMTGGCDPRRDGFVASA